MQFSPGLRLGATLLIIAAALAAMVTLMNQAGSGSEGRLGAYYEEYAGGGSCKWRQGRHADPFPTVLLVALLAYPALFVAAVGFLASLFPPSSGHTWPLSCLGLAATGLVLFWLIRLNFVRAALELC